MQVPSQLVVVGAAEGEMKVVGSEEHHPSIRPKAFLMLSPVDPSRIPPASLAQVSPGR